MVAGKQLVDRGAFPSLPGVAWSGVDAEAVRHAAMSAAPVMGRRSKVVPRIPARKLFAGSFPRGFLEEFVLT